MLGTIVYFRDYYVDPSALNYSSAQHAPFETTGFQTNYYDNLPSHLNILQVWYVPNTKTLAVQVSVNSTAVYVERMGTIPESTTYLNFQGHLIDVSNALVSSDKVWIVINLNPCGNLTSKPYLEIDTVAPTGDFSSLNLGQQGRNIIRLQCVSPLQTTSLSLRPYMLVKEGRNPKLPPYYDEHLFSWANCHVTIYGENVCNSPNETIISPTSMILYVTASVNDTSIRIVRYKVGGDYANGSNWASVTVPNDNRGAAVMIDITGAPFQFGSGKQIILELFSTRNGYFTFQV